MLDMFSTVDHRLDELEAFKRHLNPIPFGISFLDDALDGIYADDLVLITAKTGGGKTALAASIAYNAAMFGKKVHFFALEAHRSEIEARMLFKIMARDFYAAQGWKNVLDRPDYQKWLYNKQEEILGRFKESAKNRLITLGKTLKTFYTSEEFTADSFEGCMGQIDGDTDLLIIDHLHYFDMQTDKENLEMKRTIKQIKKIISFHRKPVIMVVQLRKSERFSEQLLPEVDDIHGAADIGRIATKIIASGPARNIISPDPQIWPTLFKILKNRTGGDRTFFTALCKFNGSQNNYSPEYRLGKMTKNNTEFEEIDSWNYPLWATRPLSPS